jgi:hypothetical protein
VVAWAGADTAPLEHAGVSFRALADVIGPDGLAAADAAARTWARVWGRLPLLEGRSLRDLVEWRGTSLLWAAEVFVRTATAGPACARTAERCLRLLDRTAPTEVDVAGLAPADSLLLARACTSRGVLFHGRAPALGRALRPPGPVPARRSPLRTFRFLLAPARPPALPPPLAAGGRPGADPLLVLVAGSGDAATLGPLLETLSSELCLPAVAVAARGLPRWQTRRAARAVEEGEALLRELLARLRGTPGLHESYAHRGVSFADLASRDLEALLLGRLPEAVRLIETTAELLAAARPAAVLLVVPSRDDRRAILTACTRARVWAVALRTSDPEPDDADRADGGPFAFASLAWQTGTDATPVVARLREAARGTVEAR